MAKLTESGVRIPLGNSCKVWFDLPEIFIPFPSNLGWSSIKELQIIPALVILMRLDL